MAATLTPYQRAAYEDRAWDLSVRGYSPPRIAEMLARPKEDGGLGIEITRTNVWKLLGRIEKRVVKQLVGKVERHKARQYSRLDQIIEEAREAWERSQQAAVQEKAKGVASKSASGKTKKAGDENEVSAATAESDPEALPGGCYLDEHGEEITDEERAKRVMLKAVEQARKEIKGASAEALFGLIEQTITTKYQVGDPRFLSEMRAALADQRKIYGWDAPVRQINENIDPTSMTDEELDAYIDGKGRRRKRT